MPLTRDQLLALVATNLPNNTSAEITPAKHREVEEGLANGAQLYLNDAYIIVSTTSDPSANGAALLAAYASAKSLTPNGAALSASNRAALILPPAKYSLGTTPLAIDTQFIDIIGMTGDPKSVFITSALSGTNKGTILQSVADVRFSGFTVQSTTARSANDATDVAAWWSSSSSSLTVFSDCIFDDNSGAAYAMRQATNFATTFYRCTAPDYSYAANGGSFSGKAIDCVGGAHCFSDGGNMLDGAYCERCSAGDNSFGSGATIKNACTLKYCKAGDNSFGQSVEVGCVFYDCIAGSNSFASSAFLGTAYNCRAGSNSFGKGVSLGRCFNCIGAGNECFGGNGGSSGGFFFNCSGAAGSFGGVGGTFSGRAYSCQAGALSFGGSSGGTFSGYAENCSAGGGSFGHGGTFSGELNSPVFASVGEPNSSPTPWSDEWAPSDFSGVIRDAVFSPTGSDKDAAIIPNGATGEFEMCTFRKTGTGVPLDLASGSATIKFSYCKFNTVTGIAVGITNSLGATLAAAFCIGDTDV